MRWALSLILTLEIHVALALVATFPSMSRRIEIDDPDLQISLGAPSKLLEGFRGGEQDLLENRVFPSDPMLELEYRIQNYPIPDYLKPGEG